MLDFAQVGQGRLLTLSFMMEHRIPEPMPLNNDLHIESPSVVTVGAMGHRRKVAAFSSLFGHRVPPGAGGPGVFSADWLLGFDGGGLGAGGGVT